MKNNSFLCILFICGSLMWSCNTIPEKMPDDFSIGYDFISSSGANYRKIFISLNGCRIQSRLHDGEQPVEVRFKAERKDLEELYRQLREMGAFRVRSQPQEAYGYSDNNQVIYTIKAVKYEINDNVNYEVIKSHHKVHSKAMLLILKFTHKYVPASL